MSCMERNVKSEETLNLHFVQFAWKIFIKMILSMLYALREVSGDFLVPTISIININSQENHCPKL